MSTWHVDRRVGDRRLVAEAVVALLARGGGLLLELARARVDASVDARRRARRAAGGPWRCAPRSPRCAPSMRAASASRSVSDGSRRPTSSRSESASPACAAMRWPSSSASCCAAASASSASATSASASPTRASTADASSAQLVDAALAREHAVDVVGRLGPTRDLAGRPDDVPVGRGEAARAPGAGCGAMRLLERVDDVDVADERVERVPRCRRRSSTTSDERRAAAGGRGRPACGVERHERDVADVVSSAAASSNAPAAARVLDEHAEQVGAERVLDERARSPRDRPRCGR